MSPVKFQDDVEDCSLLNLYYAACAPLKSEYLLHDVRKIDSNSLSPSVIAREFAFLQQFSDRGFQEAFTVFKLLNFASLTKNVQISKNDKSAVCSALLTASALAKRFSELAVDLSTLCSTVADSMLDTLPSELEYFQNIARSNNRVPANDNLQDFVDVDTTPESNFRSISVPVKNRVEFKKTAAVIVDGKVEEEALKVAQFQRRKQRNPTGFAKFTFKDLKMDIDNDDEDELSPTTKLRFSINSTRDSGTGTMNSISGSSEIDEHFSRDRMLSEGSSYSMQSSEDQDNELHSRQSTVGFSFDEERKVIDDKEADPDWEANQRHQKRYSRIRNRVPTGHPLLIRGSSDDLSDLLNEYETMVKTIASSEDVEANTKVNQMR